MIYTTSDVWKLYQIARAVGTIFKHHSWCKSLIARATHMIAYTNLRQKPHSPFPVLVRSSLDKSSVIWLDKSPTCFSTYNSIFYSPPFLLYKRVKYYFEWYQTNLPYCVRNVWMYGTMRYWNHRCSGTLHARGFLREEPWNGDKRSARLPDSWLILPRQ